jgi:hypothetical protein
MRYSWLALLFVAALMSGQNKHVMVAPANGARSAVPDADEIERSANQFLGRPQKMTAFQRWMGAEF